MDLDKLTIQELKALKRDVNNAIEGFESNRRRQALEDVKAAASKHGFNLAELMGSPLPRTKNTAPPKYANPADPAETWSGRGRKPQWVKNALDAGKSLDSLAI